MARVPNAVEILLKIWTAWVGRTNVTDRQTTDGRAIAYSEREREFTFANHCISSLIQNFKLWGPVIPYSHPFTDPVESYHTRLPMVCSYLPNIIMIGASYRRAWPVFGAHITFPPSRKFSMREWTYAVFFHIKFHLDMCIVSLQIRLILELMFGFPYHLRRLRYSCASCLQCFDTVGGRKCIRPVKKWGMVEVVSLLSPDGVAPRRWCVCLC